MSYLGLSPEATSYSTYIRTTDFLDAETELVLPGDSGIKILSADEAEGLADKAKKRHLFSRHSYEKNFYPDRFSALAGQTVIHITDVGTPDDVLAKAEATANIIEKLATLSAIFSTSREAFQNKLGISSKPVTGINIVYEIQFRYIRSKTIKAPAKSGLLIDQRFVRRFDRCRFPDLYTFCLSDIKIAERVLGSLSWLFESRRDPSLGSAVVKTTIALETLLIFNESDSLARSLSERAAFILSSDSEQRQTISKLIKTFYDARSGVVHGNKKKLKNLTPSLVESVDRLLLLMYLKIAANSKVWATVEDLNNWCESQKWGAPVQIEIPYPTSYLVTAIKLGNKKSETP